MSEHIKEICQTDTVFNVAQASGVEPTAPHGSRLAQVNEDEQKLHERYEEANALDMVHNLGRMRDELQVRINERLGYRSRILAWWLPVLLGVMVLLLFASALVSRYMPHPFNNFPSFLTTWTLTLIIAFPVYYYWLAGPIRAAKNELRRLEGEILNKQLTTFRGRRLFFQEELRRLTNASAKVFFEEENRYEQAAKWRQMAGDALEKKVVDLNEVQFSLNSLNEIILLEKKEKWEQRVWEYIAVFIMLVYVVGLVTAVSLMDAARSNEPTPIFGIPLSIIMWGAAGSLAAILYRFYTEKGRIKLAREVRWLIARPIIGIIMGAVVYLALISGLILVGASPNTANTMTVAGPVGRLEVYWVVAFLAGFSDKFYIGIIELLVAKTVNKRDEPENQTPDAPPATLAPPKRS